MLINLIFFLAIPVIFWFDIFIVLPQIHGYNEYFYLNTIMGTFLLFEIVSNILATVLIDCSVFSETYKLPPNTSVSLNAKKSSDWRFCSTCEVIVPPRSFHCETCKSCINKRDHHCIFAGNCVGFRNHRYFVIFLFYLFIATVYATAYNTYFIFVFHADELCNWLTILKIVLPMLMILFNQSALQYYLLIYLVGIVGACFSGALLVYHVRLILKGKTTHEVTQEYDLGTKDNLKLVFGERMFLALICPFIESKLPHNGVKWTKIDRRKNK